MGGDRPHYQPSVYGALCRQGQQVLELIMFIMVILSKQNLSSGVSENHRFLLFQLILL